MKPLFLSAILYFAIHPLAFAIPQNAELEVLQTQAVLEYNAGEYQRCDSLVGKVLTIDPENIAAIELRALILRRSKNDSAAAEAYEKLLKIAPQEKLAGYYFELATIRYKQKKISEAHRYFEKAVLGKINPGTCHFFLGVMDFDAKQWRKARQHFTAALVYSDADTIRPVSRYYLASSYSQLGKSDMAIHNYYEAEQEPSPPRTGVDTLTGDIRKNALKELNALDKGARFISISLLEQYDDNVQTNPIDQTSPDTISQERSLKTVFIGAIGYSTSPTRKIQITPSYRFYTNYNYNYLARDFDFFSQTPSLYVLYKPYAKLSMGVKAEGTFTMKNDIAQGEDASRMKYRPYSLTGDVGPLAKYELTPRVHLGAEASWRPNNYYVDPPGGDSRRSGTGLFSRLSAEFISDYTWLNPTTYLSYQWDHTEGLNFRMHAVGGGVSNPVPYSDKLTFTGFVDFALSDFSDTQNPVRSDALFSLRALANYLINAHWSAMIDTSYMENASNDPNFFYNRFLASFGATYTF